MMTNRYERLLLTSESDVEQKFIYQLLTTDAPDGLGFSESDFKTKVDIRKLAIGKGQSRKLYFPDYAVILSGLPILIIEAKAPGEDLVEAIREARLYATELNSTYPRTVNPCELVIATDGQKVMACHWDHDAPFIELTAADLSSVNESFAALLSAASKKVLQGRADAILVSIRSSAHYMKPIFMLGGKAVINETVGENSFGANVSIEYKYLFNPESMEDRESIVRNAYVTSKRKQSHVAPIDKLIRAALPRHLVDARPIGNSAAPKEIFNELSNVDRIRNEICLLVGSVGSGKSTFTDYLRLEALPQGLRAATEWVNVNLNQAPLSRERIYEWVLNRAIAGIAANHPSIDFNELSTLKQIYSAEIALVEKGRASMYPKDSDRYIDIIFGEIERLQKDLQATLKGTINFLHRGTKKVQVIVLDNCDKRNRDDQLLMFEVASWLKSEFSCMVFLPLRDTTYDQYKDEPPLDTVIKDLVFRIDPPLLEKVIYARLSYALREIANQSDRFTFHLPNGMRVECAREEVGDYLKSMVASLFQDPLFKRIITGLTGRNIRKGLEILLDFCKSGHIGTDEILKVKTSAGEHRLPNHLVARILLKGKRKYYSDREAHIKNLFESDETDSLPDPFVRVSILQWLKINKKIPGPNRTIGFHKISTLLSALQAAGHSASRILKEVAVLTLAGCIIAESQSSEISPDDLISIAPAGFVHLDLLKNINYLSTVSEDVLFRENQVAQVIANNIIGKGNFKIDSRQASIINSKTLVDYLSNYYENFFVGPARVLAPEEQIDLINLPDLATYVHGVAANDEQLRNVSRYETEYPPGSQTDAQVVSVQNYGFFVEFGLNGSGLVHKSQLTPLNYPLSDVEEGDWVTVEIAGYNSTHKKFDLKLVKFQEMHEQV